MQLSRVLGMTGANVRHHLAELEKLGMVAVAGQEAATGRGRPTLVYMATAKAQPSNLAVLASALMQTTLGTRESKQRTIRLKRLAENLRAGNGRQSGALAQRLVTAVQHLNPLGYKARWEAHAQGARVILGQCPYAAIIEQHPELCQMDAYLIEGMTGVKMEQIAKMKKAIEGPMDCVFAVRGD